MFIHPAADLFGNIFKVDLYMVVFPVLIIANSAFLVKTVFVFSKPFPEYFTDAEIPFFLFNLKTAVGKRKIL